MTGTVRRVVTGHDADGKAIVVSDGEAPNVLRPPQRPGTVINTLWAVDGLPVKLGGLRETVDRQIPIEPPLNGCSFRINEYPPPEAGLIGKLDREAARANFAAMGAAHAADTSENPRHPLMHRTQSLDFAIVLSGEIYLVLDDSEVLLKTGDTVIQCGTNHAWSNRSDKPCRMAFVMLGAELPAGR